MFRISICLTFLALITATSAPFCLAASQLSEPESKEIFKAWQEIQNRGEKASEACEYGNAERLLTEAVKLERMLGNKDIRLAKSPGELGRLLTVRGRFDEAELYLEEEFNIKKYWYGDDYEKLIPAMAPLIRFYLVYGTAKKADDLTYDLLAFVEGKIREQSTQPRGRVAFRKGTSLKGWAGTAAPVARDPLLEWAIICDSIGDIYKGRGELDMAERLYKAGLDMKTTILGKKHLALAYSYERLAQISMKNGDYEEAEVYYNDAWDIAEKILEPDNYKYYGLLNQYAKCLIREKKYGEAERLYLKAEKIWQAQPSGRGYEQQTLFALGCLYADQRRFATAAPYLGRALRIAERDLGPWSYQIVPYLKKYAYVKYYLGQKADRGSLNARANTISPILKPLKTTRKMETGNFSKKAK